MLGSILVPLDGSAYAEQALGPALSVARRSGGQITLCRVHEPVGCGSGGNRIEDHTAMLGHVGAYMGMRTRQLAQQVGQGVNQRIEEGAPVPALTRVAQEVGADLVVLTTHGHGGLTHAWLGGTVEGLVHQAKAPLLLVRPTLHDEPAVPDIRRIMVPLDGSLTAEAVLGTALEFAGLFDAQVQLLGVVELPVELPARLGEKPVRLSGSEDPEGRRGQARAYLDGIADGLRSEGLSVEVEVRDAIGPATAILQVAAEYGADLIAMATHGRTRLRRQAVGSVSARVIRAAGVPVLLVPSREVEVQPAWPGAAAATVGV